MKAVVIKNKALGITEIEAPTIQDNLIKVRVVAFGVNRTDFIQQQITSFEGTIPGVEFSGYVSEVGNITHKNVPIFELGDRVCGFIYKGAFAESVVCNPRHVVQIPAGYGIVPAAGLIYDWFSAIDALHLVAGFKKRDKVLLHIGERTVLGTSLAQYAQAIGCRRMYVITESDAHTEFARENLKLLGALPDELVVINRKRVDWVSAVKMIDPRGIQVVINESTHEFEGDSEVLSSGGSLVYIGPRQQVSNNSRLALKGIRVQTTNLRLRDPEYLADICAYFKERLIDRFSNGRLKVHLYRAVPWESISSAMMLIETNIQKIVCTVSSPGLYPILPENPAILPA